MSSTFKFHSQVNEAVPWNAQYTFPTQATKVTKSVVKLPTKNGSQFTGGQVMRIEFPADNYMNVLNSYLVFDVGVDKSSATRMAFQRGGAQNLIKRLRIMYGSLVIEDIQEYKTLVRIFHECAIPQDYRESAGSILDGMAANMNIELPATSYGLAGEDATTVAYGTATGAGTTSTVLLLGTGGGAATSGTDVYVDHILEITGGTGVGQSRRIVSQSALTVTLDGPALAAATDNTTVYRILKPGGNAGSMISDAVARDILPASSSSPSYTSRRSYCLNLLSGLLTCKKLIPLKWMAAQLSIEITLASLDEAFLYDTGSPTYGVLDPQFVAEMLEFDSTYDQAFFMGLTQGGVPLKFSSWHYHSFGVSGTNNVVQIHERARSVKAGFAVIRDQNAVSGDKQLDSDRFFHAPGQTFTAGKLTASTRTTGAITEFQWRVGGKYYPSQPVRCTYGAPEAYVELMKAINTFGDYTSANAINVYNWSTAPGSGTGDKFIMACEFENTDAMPGTIAGINAEEQSDIALTIKANEAMASNRQLDVFMHYDSLLVVRDGNVVDLIV
jgi:hypothetical protein